MKERKAVTKLLCDQYRKSDKSGKMQILNQFVEATGYNRHYAAWLLRQHGRRVRIGPQVAVQGDVRLPDPLMSRSFCKLVFLEPLAKPCGA